MHELNGLTQLHVEWKHEELQVMSADTYGYQAARMGEVVW